MEAVSAVKMRKSQERALQSRVYAQSAVKILTRISGTSESVLDIYTKERREGKRLLVIVTSDKGLAGSVNSAVLKQAENILNKHSCDCIAIGRKAVEFVGRTANASLIDEYTNISDDVLLDDVLDIATKIVDGYKDETYREVHVIYQNFLSTFEQEPVVRQILPLIPDSLFEIVAGIQPTKGKYSKEITESNVTSYTVEPSPEDVFATLLPQLIKIMVYHALLENKASEHSARMVAMKNATDKAKDVVKELTLVYNKKRQAAITAEVSEITAGIEALKT